MATSLSNLLHQEKIQHNIRPQVPKDDTIVDLQKTEKRIQIEVFQKQIRVKEVFTDFDQLRKGYMTEDKFRSALALLKIHLTYNEIDAIINKYKIEKDLINWKAFLATIDEVFADPELSRKNLIKKNPDITPDVTNLLITYKHLIKTKRILLKQPFQDFDKTSSSRISITQFARVLNQLKMLPQEQYFKQLVQYYLYPGSQKEVNYMRFISDIDDTKEMNNLAQQEVLQQKYMSQDIIEDITKCNFLETLFVSKKLPNINDPNKVEEKVQAEVVIKSIRIQEIFRDFDPLRKGTCTETQFRRVMHMQNLNLKDEEMDTLMKKYKRPDSLVEYKKFCDKINEIFTLQELEKDPLVKVKQMDSTITLPARRNFLTFSEEEKYQLEQLIINYRIAIANRRVLLKPHFQDFDKTKQGYTSKNQFLRILHQFGLFPDEKNLNLLLRKYIDKGNLDEVNYEEFCKDIDITLEEDKFMSKTHANAFKDPKNSKTIKINENLQITNDAPDDLDSLLGKIRTIIKKERIRLQEFMRDFDKLRCGEITTTQFRSALNMAKIQLSSIEFQLILDKFSSPTNKNYLKWKDFCDTIDEVFLIKNLEKTNPGMANKIPNLTYSYFGQLNIQDQQLKLADAVKQRFMHFIKTRRIDIKQFFKDWDKLGRNKVSPKQFRQVLSITEFPISEQEFQAIVKVYLCQDDGDIKYVDFINDTTPPYEYTLIMGPKRTQEEKETLAREEMKKQFSTTSTIKMKSPSELQTQLLDCSPVDEPQVLLNKLKTAIFQHQIRAEEFLLDFDPLRKGTITKQKFRGILSILKLEYNENELKLLEALFQDQSDYTKIDFNKFLEEINKVFAEKQLEKDPIKKVEKFKPPQFLDPKYILTPDEQQRLHLLLTQMGDGIRKQRIQFKSHFQDKDKTRSGKIGFNRFRAILDTYSLPLTEPQFKLLCKRFSHQGIEFNYVEFDKIMKDYEQYYQNYF